MKRLLASLEIAGRDRGFGPKQRRRCVRAGSRSYRKAMAAFAGMGDMELWYVQLDIESSSEVWLSCVSAADQRRFDKLLGWVRSPRATSSCTSSVT